MPMHDWSRVQAGIYHAFHHEWISAIGHALNQGVLPPDHYALPEQFAAGFGPDVLTLRGSHPKESPHGGNGVRGTSTLQTRPKTRFTAEMEGTFYRRKQKLIAVRHVSDDEIVAIIEIVSPGNKSGRTAFKAFLDKVNDLLEQRIHLLIVDPLPPGTRDPNGIHAAIWEDLHGDSFALPADKQRTLVSYECDLVTRAYIEPVGIGELLPDMPLFLEPDGCVMVPLEATYQTAFGCLPGRWREVLAPTSP